MEKIVKELYTELVEAIGDNKVDNMTDELKRATEVELDRFVSQMLQTNVKRFASAYALPQYEAFRESFKDILLRYQVMDGEEKGDLFVKIEQMFKDIFTEKYAGLGPEAAELTAKLYAEQMIKVFKDNSIQMNTEMYPEKSVY